jgi:hypothetical protein
MLTSARTLEEVIVDLLAQLLQPQVLIGLIPVLGIVLFILFVISNMLKQYYEHKEKMASIEEESEEVAHAVD